MYHNTPLESGVSYWGGVIPQKQRHIWRISVDGGYHHGIVEPSPYLDVHNDRVICAAPLEDIRSLEVPGHLVKSERVEDIMTFVHGVESLGDCGVAIFLRAVHLRIVIVVELAFSSFRAVTIGARLQPPGI